ncbi:MAG: type II toxin-antitoxin system HicB family antitoxin [Gemmatimonadetes bacterium]|nr:type II toxin-antitoxin system HicB family antitoxin [Gemmatimonadota bacterium]
MRSYTFRIEIEKDSFPGGEPGFFVRVPALEHLGAATQGRTREEAMSHIHEVLQMIVEDLVEEGQPIPAEAATVSDEPLVTVTL